MNVTLTLTDEEVSDLVEVLGQWFETDSLNIEDIEEELLQPNPTVTVVEGWKEEALATRTRMSELLERLRAARP